MGNNTWNAKAWHRAHKRPRLAADRTRRQMRMVTAATLLVVLGIAGGAVAVAHGAAEDSGRIGICHATGADEMPYVYIVVDRNGAAHGHHDEHENDIVDTLSAADCPGPSTAAASEESGSCLGPEETQAVPALAEPEAVEAQGSEDDAEPEADDAPADDASVDVPADAASADAEHPSEASTPDVMDCAADLSLVSAGAMQGGRLSYDFLVTSLGPEEVNEAWLNVSLPDVGKNWTVASSDASACTLSERTILCDFDDLVAGETRSVQASAPRCPQDCGEDIDAAAEAGAFNDGDETNNVAPVTIVIPDCGVTPPAPPPTEEASNETAPPEENTTAPPADDNATEPPANDTDENATSDVPPPAEPQHADVRLLQLSQQDDEQVTLAVRVVNRGPGVATNVSLADALPDVRRGWFLGGDDSADCILDGRDLSCAFGDLASGEERVVMLRAYTDRLPCGEHKVNTASVNADNDETDDNNRSSASIQARAC